MSIALKKQLIPVVDKNDRIIGYKDRERITRDDIYRISALWIRDPRGRILLAKRAATKSHAPNRWAPAVAGTIEKGETYTQNIKKEAEEELGIHNIAFTKRPKIFTRHQWTHFCQPFILTVDWPLTRFHPDPHEISELRWFTQATLKKKLHLRPDAFVSSMPSLVKNLL